MPRTQQKHAAAGRSSRMILLHLSLTPKEAEVLVRLLEHASNEPGEEDAAEFAALRDKTRDALTQYPKTESAQPGSLHPAGGEE